jgi:hypothetical protein
MISSTVIQNLMDLQVKFILNTTPKTITVTELADYDSLAFDFPGGDYLKGILKITAPDGSVIHQGVIGSPDFLWDGSMYGSSADDELTGVTIPNDANGDPLLGNYTFLYTLHYYDAATDTEVEITKTVIVCLKDLVPTGVVSGESNCHESKLTVTDTTSYPAGTTIDRTLLIKAPFKANGDPVTADVTTTQAAKIVTPIYTGVYSFLLSSDVEVPLGDGGWIIDTVEATATHEVVCDQSLCDIFCCLQKLTVRMAAAKYNNAKVYQELYYQWAQVVLYYVLFRQANECGRYSAANTYYQNILTLAGCEPGCGCTDGTPELIVALGGGASAADVEVRAGSNVVVNVTVEGDTTVYTVGVSPTLDDRVTALEAISINLVNGSPTYFTITDASGTKTLTWAGPKLDQLDFLIDIDLVGNPNYSVTITKKEMMAFGGRYSYVGDAAGQNPKITWADTAPSTFEEVANANMVFKIYDFLASTGADAWLDKPFIDIVDFDMATGADTVRLSGNIPYDVQTVKVSHDEIWFRIAPVGLGGSYPVTQQFLSDSYGFTKLTLHVRITPRQF